MGKLFQVGISGSYGGLNPGDEAILEGMLAQLRASLPVEVTVFSRNPGDTRDRHAVERAVPVRDMSRGTFPHTLASFVEEAHRPAVGLAHGRPR